MYVFIKQLEASNRVKKQMTSRYAQSHTVTRSFMAMPLKILPLSMLFALNITPVLAELPVPSANFVHAGDASYLINADNLTVNQASEKAILNWQSFNVGADNSVTFKQPGSSSIALNRIGQNDPSKILGTINANGQIYLYNQNGFVFGEGVRFNANNMVATTLDVDDEVFTNNSVLNAINNSDVNNRAAFFDADGDNTGKIEIKPGAEINADSILMIASEIVNEGVLNSADGQTILAASKDKVYLTASDNDSDLRGLLVEVGTGGTVTNAAAGSINAERGNVTLIGYAVNQRGRIRATTSVDKNGSIRLLARDNASTFENTVSNFDSSKESIGVDGQPTAENFALAQSSGQLILGKNSRTEIAVDNDTVTKVPDAQEQLKSKVEIVGNQVWLEKNSQIIAPSGEVKITATNTPGAPLQNTSRNDSYVYMDSESIIDVSGSDTAILSMERNSVAVEVRSNELADSPEQRDGVLRGETVYIDLRKGTDLVNFSGAVATVEKTAAERLATGGNIDIKSEGDFVQRDGAIMDISGGKVSYEDGFIKETKLISQGQITAISDANRLLQYDGIVGDNTKTHGRWAVTETFSGSSSFASDQYVNSFVEGKAAGNIEITAAASILSQTGIKADTIVGPYQSGIDQLPKRGELNLNFAQFNDSTQNVTFILESALAEVTDAIAHVPDSVDLQRENVTTDLILSDSYLKDNALGKLTINTLNEVVIDSSATVEAQAGSELNLTGSAVTVNGNIINRAGSVNLSAVPVISGDRSDLVVADNVQIDVSGYWINKTEFAGETSSDFPELVDGGDINLFAEGDVTIGKDVKLNASAGALLDVNSDLTAGKGGDISLIARHKDGATLENKGNLSSYSLTSGGTLHLEAANVLISDDASIVAGVNQLILNSSVFESGGFSRYEVVANAGDLVVDAVLSPIMQNLKFNDAPVTSAGSNRNSASTLPLIETGTVITDIAEVATLADFERASVDLDFTLQQVDTDASYNLIVTEQAALNLDPAAKLSFNSDTSIFFGGKVNAPAADVTFSITTPATETGFLTDQAIWLADGSVIDVSSTAVYETNELSLRIGEVFDAGSVSFNANRGYVVVEEGARIDVSAKTETLDLLVNNAAGDPEYQAFDVSPDAGQVSILSAEGAVVDGELIANAASSDGAKGGAFSLELNTNIRNISIDQSNALSSGKFDFSSRDIVIDDADGSRLDNTVGFGDNIDDSLQKTAYVDVTNLQESGFDTLKLKTDNVVTSQSTSASEIRIDSDTNLSFKESIVLSTPTLNSNDNNITLNSAYVALGSDSRSRNSVAVTPVAGEEEFNVNAALIDIIGDINITKTSLVNLAVSDDIRFIGAISTQTTEQLTGSLVAATDINLSASQIYPATFSQASVDLINDPSGTVTIKGNGEATPVLSALGELTINAPNIVQGGVLKAPLGSVRLNASETINLLPDSVISISAEDQIIPFGETINAGGDWTYTITTPVKVELADKSIELNAPNVDMQENSVVDISGGGDLATYEFVSGPTGSSDVLLPENAGDTFVILPASNNQYAPYDFLISNDTGTVGQQIYLEAGKDFAEGYYTILPARYALLPGAKLVTPFELDTTILPGAAITRIDGAPVHAGKYATANTDIVDNIYSAFVVEDGSVARTRSEYIDSSANTFFASLTPQDAAPQDAGALVIDTIDSLAVSGIIRGDHAEGTKGSRLDILANNIEVIAAGSDTQTSDFIQLTDVNLNELAVDSLMLGGKRRIDDAETTVSVQSDSIAIRDNVNLELPEILLVAKNQIETNAGSVINGKGAISNKSDTFILDNNASILGVTVNALPTISRTGSSSGASINLLEGSTLAADNSIFVNSSNDVTLQANILLDGGNLSLGAKNVSLGTALANVSGLNLSSELIASLLVDQLEINSIESISIFEDINLAFSNLAITAPGINGKSATGVNVQLTASGDVVLRQNGFSADANDPLDGFDNGSFNVTANNILLAGNDEAFLFDGFDNAKFTTTASITGAGYGDGIDNTINNVFDFGLASVILDTPLIKGEAGSALTVNSQSSVAMLNSTATVAEQVDALGSTFMVNASDVVVDTNVVFPSGLVTLNAQGLNSDDNVTLTANAMIDTSGRTIDYVDGSQAGSSGGLVSLSSDFGNVETEAGSIINISSSSVAGNGGSLNISAVDGTAILAGEINTAHAAGFDGSSASVDVGQLSDLATVLNKLQTDGFSQRQYIRLRNGDINISLLAGNEANIKANEIILTADNGNVGINGILDAAGESAGRIEVYASGDIDVSGAILNAFATNDDRGGELLLATTNGTISVDSSTQVDVSANKFGISFDSGKVGLRAPRINTNTDVAVTNFDATVSGAERIDIEGFTSYNDAVIGSAQQTVYSNDASSWLANKNTVLNRLGLLTDNRVHLLAGVEVFNSGDITISDAVDFYQWQLDSTDVIDEGAFTVRASDNLNINASLSDAIRLETFDFVNFVPTIENGESWNYRLVSGADLSSANLLATTASNTSGNLTLAPNVAVRTGKGDINIASGGNLVLDDKTSVIYTVGQGNGTGRFDIIDFEFSAIQDGPQFPNQGGDINIDVAGDIQAAISDQFFTDWVQRYGGVTNFDNGNPIPGLWAIVINDFQQGIATLGGGDLNVIAGGDIVNLSLSTPQNGQLTANNDVVVRGGGDINVQSGGDIRSARILADGGKATVRARGDVIADGNGLNTLIAMGDASVNIEAGGDITIEGIGNITMLPLSTLQSGDFVSLTDAKNTAYFYSYSDQSKVDLLSYYGDITLNNDIEAIKTTTNNILGSSSVFPWSIYPGEFSATTLSGDISINDSFTLFPDADGNLNLRAAADITSRSGSTRQQVFVSVSDVAISVLPSISEPANLASTVGNSEVRLNGGTDDQSLLHDEVNGPLHVNDNEPLSIVANNNITANGELKLRSPKKTQIVAGNDIRDLGIELQNIKETDKSIVIAGGDISYSLPDTGSIIVSEGIRVAGPGSITVMAGGNIDLGISKGIRSLGNLDNSTLSSEGADIAVFAGIKNNGLNDELDTAKFISTYFKGEASDETALIDIDIAGYQQQLVDYVLSEQYNGDLTQAVTDITTLNYATNEEAVIAFKTLTPEQQIDVAINSYSNSKVSEQRKLILDVFVNELNLAAETVAATEDDSEYARGFLAINSLFPSPVSNETVLTTLSTSQTDSPGGDINLPFSRIQSTSGGDINLFAPQGELNVGFTAEVENSSTSSGPLGVVISGQGDLSAMTDGNINVNLSRMQALNGGDISLWSSSGDIDAGRGAKTALTIPPPIITVNSLGQIEITFPPAVSGSGINAGVSSEGLKPGKVTLAAPGGVVNASDGGIGSAGDLVVAATKVLGGDNFSAGGATVGVPVATNVTAGLSGLSSSTDNAVSSASEAASSAASSSAGTDSGIAIVTVELLATGDEYDDDDS